MWVLKDRPQSIKYEINGDKLNCDDQYDRMFFHIQPFMAASVLILNAILTDCLLLFQHYELIF